MTLTHAQLMDAVRAAGRDRESFTCADVRQQLGLSTADRVQMNRFYKRFSALQKSATDEIEKLGNNCYRLLRVSVVEAPAVEAPAVDGPVVQAHVVEAPVVEAPVAHAAAVESPFVAALIAEIPDVEPPATVEPVQRLEAAPVVLAQAVAEDAVDAQPAVSTPPPAKPRAQWLSRMASFFSRRPSKSDVGVAVGA
jgi:hypothetical protein